jgi:hypothetical protein
MTAPWKLITYLQPAEGKRAMRKTLLLIAVSLFITAKPGLTSQTELIANTIPFMLLEDEYIILEVKVNDSTTGTWAFDTGAGIHILSNKLFRQLQVTPAGRLTGFRMDGKRLDFDVYQVASISVGPCREENPYVVTWDVLDSLGIDGVLSIKLFENRPVSLDLKNNQLVLETDETLSLLETKGKIVGLETQRYRDKSLDIFVEFVGNDSIPIEMELDTGSGKNTFLDSRLMQSLGIDSTSANLEVHPLEADTAYYATLGSLSLRDAPRIRADSVKVHFKKGLIYDGVIGIDFWKGRQVTIDIPGRRFIISE